MLALFPSPPSFRACITFDPQRKVIYAWKEGVPGNEARSVWTWRVAVGICENGPQGFIWRFYFGGETWLTRIVRRGTTLTYVQ